MNKPNEAVEKYKIGTACHCVEVSRCFVLHSKTLILKSLYFSLF